jgi:hypothetical protein
MAKQASTFGYGTAEAWAFGPGTRSRTREPARNEPVPVVEAAPAPEYGSAYQQPAVFAYEQPAVFAYERPAVFLTEPYEAPAAERDVWDQLPPERPKRSRRYVGKHRA